MISDGHGLVADEVHKGEVCETLVLVEVQGALEYISGVEDEGIHGVFAAINQDGSLAGVSADGFSSDGDGLDVGMEVVGVKNGEGEVLGRGILQSGGHGAGEEGTKEE